MGMNYYVHIETCPTCKHPKEEIHLGKSSWGWQFSFQYNGGQYYKNVLEMKKWLLDKDIYNEEGEQVTYEEFWQMVKEKQKKSNKNHAKVVLSEERYESYRDREQVIDGYSFSDCYFS